MAADALTPFDLKAYFNRIDYGGGATPTAACLAEIHQRHLCAIPFENLDIHLGRGIAIDLASVTRKLIHDERGGYCFEQNTLMAAALRQIGFNVLPLVARVRWQLPADAPTALTHMLLRVEVPDDGSFLADVGFGGMSLIRPLRLELDRPQVAGLEPRRVVSRGNVLVQQAQLAGKWEDVYLFSPDEAPPIDFEVGNWYTSTYPLSRFRLNLIVSRAGAACRRSLLNRELATRYADGRAEKRTIDGADELLTVLHDYFDLRFPAGTRFAPGTSVAWPN